MDEFLVKELVFDIQKDLISRLRNFGNDSYCACENLSEQLNIGTGYLLNIFIYGTNLENLPYLDKRNFDSSQTNTYNYHKRRIQKIIDKIYENKSEKKVIFKKIERLENVLD